MFCAAAYRGLRLPSKCSCCTLQRVGMRTGVNRTRFPCDITSSLSDVSHCEADWKVAKDDGKTVRVLSEAPRRDDREVGGGGSGSVASHIMSPPDWGEWLLNWGERSLRWLVFPLFLVEKLLVCSTDIYGVSQIAGVLLIMNFFATIARRNVIFFYARTKMSFMFLCFVLPAADMMDNIQVYY